MSKNAECHVFNIWRGYIRHYTLVNEVCWIIKPDVTRQASTPARELFVQSSPRLRGRGTPSPFKGHFDPLQDIFNYWTHNGFVLVCEVFFEFHPCYFSCYSFVKLGHLRLSWLWSLVLESSSKKHRMMQFPECNTVKHTVKQYNQRKIKYIPFQEEWISIICITFV